MGFPTSEKRRFWIVALDAQYTPRATHIGFDSVCSLARRDHDCALFNTEITSSFQTVTTEDTAMSYNTDITDNHIH